MDEDTALPGTGIVRVDTRNIREEWLLLPEGFEIVNAEMDSDGQIIVFTVKHKDVPISPSGAELPIFTPIFRTKRDEDGIRWHRLEKIHVTERKL